MAVFAVPARWLWYSSVPGMAVPGMACPGMAGTGSYPMWIYIGLPSAATYLDYLDLTVPRTLSVVTGQWYAMLVASSRAGLTIPPPDHRWAPACRGHVQLRRLHGIPCPARRGQGAQLPAAGRPRCPPGHVPAPRAAPAGAASPAAARAAGSGRGKGPQLPQARPGRTGGAPRWRLKSSVTSR